MNFIHKGVNFVTVYQTVRHTVTQTVYRMVPLTVYQTVYDTLLLLILLLLLLLPTGCGTVSNMTQGEENPPPAPVLLLDRPIVEEDVPCPRHAHNPSASVVFGLVEDALRQLCIQGDESACGSLEPEISLDNDNALQ